jgi:hypothetical protein
MLIEVLLQNPAFPAAVQAMESTPIERAYLVIVASALSGAIIYLYIQGEKKAKQYIDKLEKLMQDGSDSKKKLSDSIDRLNRDSDDRHRKLIEIIDRK